ncbi:MAG: hypothetical protein JXA77_18545 [Bacteroidales bacterium]|nr:hypothetical protein [Bacteroidales bacterium]MBN2818186.1 hypothetical protein [Bacteroidales bacterium]
MKQIIYILLFVSIFCFNNQTIEAKETLKDNYIANSASDFQYVGCLSGFFNNPAELENWQYSFQLLIPKNHKSSSINRYSETKPGLQRSFNVNHYVLFTENHIVRFVGADIIHPFNYFW